MTSPPTPPAPDQAQRDQILSRLDANILIEAAAGTGKTTILVGRMIELLAAGVCRINEIAAVTFTRKAAAEMRARFQTRLEQSARTAEGPAAARLSAAADNLEQCFIGTIHSFCARLLRERPVEAGVDIDFREIEDDENNLLCREAWQTFVAGLYAGNDPSLDELPPLGMEITDLGDAFALITDYADVSAWPTEPVPTPDYDGVRRALADYLNYLGDLAPGFPEDRGTDQLMNRCEVVLRLAARLDPEKPRDLVEVMEACDRDPDCTQKYWPGGAKQGKAVTERWKAFREEVAGPFIRAIQNQRYRAAIPLLLRARAVYDDIRARRGVLTFQDLLLKARALLRDHPQVRAFFRRRWTRVLVDEFQDTDPLQAEIMMLLTAADPDETDWRRCRPAPGALVVVGDPKQSIYRFRRADIVTYKQVRALFEDEHGMVIPLAANFRSHPAVITWVNEVFANPASGFPAEATPESPAYVALLPGRSDYLSGRLQGVATLVIPEESAGTNAAAVDYDVAAVTDIISRALAENWTIARMEEEAAAELTGGAQPSDFLIITYTTNHLAAYARALRDAHIPHRVTGGGALNRLEELALLRTVLTAVLYPEDPVALVAALRSEVFGISDADLYDYKRGGGVFDYRRIAARDETPREAAAAIAAIYHKLATYAAWFRLFPPAVALERMAADLGLPARAAAANGGNLRAGALLKALELIRTVQQGNWSIAGTAAYLDELIAAEERSLRHDALPARAEEGGAVRIMNLHKAKGLEAAVVFIADPTGGGRRFEAEVHIDREGADALGYMRLAVANPYGGGRTIARPPRWDDFAAVEERFAAAEGIRLLYVAATRARAQVLVSQRAARNQYNPWRTFESYLAPFEAPPAPVAEAPARQPQEPDPVMDLGGLPALEDRKHRLVSATYETAAAKQAAGAYRPIGGSEHGTEFGTVVHFLLQALAADPSAALARLALAAADEHGLPPEQVPTALVVVHAVAKSALWKRSQRARRRFTELPYHKGAEVNAAGLPRLERGVIDLVFEEADGWVIVDYKTDAYSSERIELLIDKYRSQLLAYKDAWEKGGAGLVKETDLYFLNADRQALYFVTPDGFRVIDL